MLSVVISSRSLLMLNGSAASRSLLRWYSSKFYEQIVKENWKKISLLRPPKNFMLRLSTVQKEYVKKILKEIKLFVWFSDKCPTKLTTENWLELLDLCKVHLRVKYLSRLADDEQVTRPTEKSVTPLDNDLFRAVKRDYLLKAKRYLNSEKLRLSPELVIYLCYQQYIPDSAVEGIGEDIHNGIQTNLASRRPFPITVTNCKFTASNFKKFALYSGKDNPLYPYYSLLTFRSDDILKLYSRKDDCIFINMYANKVLTGSLDKKTYVICCSANARSEQLLYYSYCNKVEFARLPMYKGYFYPLAFKIRVLQNVYHNNYDWDDAVRTELRNFKLEENKYKKYNSLSADEIRENTSRMRALLDVIVDATENSCGCHAEDSSSKNFSCAYKESPQHTFTYMSFRNYEFLIYFYSGDDMLHFFIVKHALRYHRV